MVKSRTWAAGILLLLAVCAGLMLWLDGRGADGTVANIYQDGVCIRSVDLSRITRAEEFTVESGAGENVIRIEPGRICIVEADCPDQVCVRTGWLTDGAAPVVCLPHRLVIRLEASAAGQDGETGQPDTVAR